MKSFTINEWIQLQQQGADILDTRDTEKFKQGFVPTAVNIPLKNIADWANSILQKEKKILLVTEAGKEAEAIQSLKNTGFAKVEGYLQGGFEAWKSAGHPIDMIIDVEPDELMMDIPFDKNLIVVDVRKAMEYAEGHLKDAVNLPLSAMADPLQIARFEDSDNLYLHCGGGTRSVIAASVLKKHGIHNLRNVVGGLKKIKEEPKAEIVKEPGILN